MFCRQMDNGVERSRTMTWNGQSWLSWVQTKTCVSGESYKSLQAGLYFPGGVGAGNSRKGSHTAVRCTKQGRQMMNRMIAELSPIHD